MTIWVQNYCTLTAGIDTMGALFNHLGLSDYIDCGPVEAITQRLAVDVNKLKPVDDAQTEAVAACYQYRAPNADVMYVDAIGYEPHTPGYSRAFIDFETVNNPAVRLIEFIAEEYPNVRINLDYLCDEQDLGGNCYRNPDIHIETLYVSSVDESYDAARDRMMTDSC